MTPIKVQTTLAERVGESWAEQLKDFWEKPELKAIASKVSEERKTKEIYPTQENVFRAFRETPFNTVKVVILGQDPYNDIPGQATGIAMDCGKYVSNTVKKILEVYDKEYPSHFNTDLMDGRLVPWARQGVFLMNAALTVEKKNPGSHIKIWKPFTQFVLNRLMYDMSPKVFVALGNFAQETLGEVFPPHHLLKYEHPVAASYDNREWKAVGIFHEINKILKFHGIPEINW